MNQDFKGYSSTIPVARWIDAIMEPGKVINANGAKITLPDIKMPTLPCPPDVILPEAPCLPCTVVVSGPAAGQNAATSKSRARVLKFLQARELFNSSYQKFKSFQAPAGL